MPPANRPVPSDLGREEREIRRRIAALRRQGHRQCGVSALPADGSIDAFETALGTSIEHHEEVVRRRLADRSWELTEAFERVRDGTYGTCRACGCRIPRRRPQALSTATLCVTCREQREVARAA
jgi:RNA polymerase-binding transcription factor DksA